MICSITSVINNPLLFSSNLTGEIEKYRLDVERNKISCNLPSCTICQTLSTHFKRHAIKERQFYVIVDDVIKVVICMLIRWKCSGCGKTFTQYPRFALPYQRHIVPTIMSYCKHYVENDRMTYRRLIAIRSAEYQIRQNDVRQLDHSTVFRWTAALGSFSNVIRNAQELILKSDPGSTITRELAQLTISAKKYVKEARKHLLIKCRQLLNVENIFCRIFGVSIFTNLATKAGYT